MHNDGMRLCPFILVVALSAGTFAGCAVEDRDPDGSQPAARIVPATTFTLTVGSDGENVSVTSASGTIKCGVGCTLSFPAGTPVSVTAQIQNLGDCLKFDSWDGACTGQGRPCSLVMNSDLDAGAHYVRIFGCVPQ